MTDQTANELEAYVAANPTMTQGEVCTHFGITQHLHEPSLLPIPRSPVARVVDPKTAGNKRKVDYDEVVAYTLANPAMIQADIAAHFGISQCCVSHICTPRGVKGTRRGRVLKVRPNQSTLEAEWEGILHNLGLGTDRAMQIHSKRILYGYDPIQESKHHCSATAAN